MWEGDVDVDIPGEAEQEEEDDEYVFKDVEVVPEDAGTDGEAAGDLTDPAGGTGAKSADAALEGDTEADYTLEDGNVSSDSDDSKYDREQQILQEACLPVSGAPLPPGDGVPQNADEYLRQVQWERMHCQDVVYAEVEEKPGRQRRTKRHGACSYLASLGLPRAPAGELYCPEWAEDVAKAFVQLRARCQEVQRGAVASGGGTASLDFETWRRRCKGRPSTRMLADQDFVSVNNLIVVAVEAVVVAYQEPAPSAAAAEDGPAAGAPASGDAAAEPAGAAAVAKEPAVDPQRLDVLLEWIFAALAFVELPLVDDIQYQLQRLKRTCLSVAAGTGDPGRHSLPRASVLLVIVTEVFGQQ